MIEPTVGRIVWYRPSEQDREIMVIQGDQPLAAVVAYVWNSERVNLTVFDHTGAYFPRSSIVLNQSDRPCTASPSCEWMPYQKGQAAKYEALEREKSNA